MRIGVLSFNVDSEVKIPEKETAGLFSSPLDFYVEMTQEDARELNTPPLANLPKDLSLLASHSMNWHQSKQNILLKVFSSVKVKPTIEKGRISLSIRNSTKYKAILPFQDTFGFTTKGAVYIHVKYNSYSFLFINLHLPVYTKTIDENGEKRLKNETLGYEYRAKSLQYILQKLKPLIEKTSFTVIGGDLNFRINPNGEDQLDKLLQTYTYAKEFPFPDDSSKTYTCKFLTKDIYKGQEDLTSCRLTPIEGSTERKECHDKERIPSRCDRFLYHSKYIPRVEKQESFVFLDESDHNAMYLVFSLDDILFTYNPSIKVLMGGKTRRKYRKSKTYRKRS